MMAEDRQLEDGYSVRQTDYLYPFGHVLVIACWGTTKRFARWFYEYHVLAPRAGCKLWFDRVVFEPMNAAVKDLVISESVEEQAFRHGQNRLYRELVNAVDGDERMVPEAIRLHPAGRGDLIGLRLREECGDQLEAIAQETHVEDLRDLLFTLASLRIHKISP